MARMDITFRLGVVDWKAFVRHAYGRIGAATMPPLRHFTIQAIVFLPLGMAFAGFLRHWQEHRCSDLAHFKFGLTYLVLWLMALYASAWYRNSRLLIKSIAEDGAFSQQQTVAISEVGLAVQKADSLQQYQWSAIKHLAIVAEGAYFYLDTNAAIVVPRSAFPRPDDAGAFFARAQEFKSAGNALHSVAANQSGL